MSHLGRLSCRPVCWSEPPQPSPPDRGSTLQTDTHSKRPSRKKRLTLTWACDSVSTCASLTLTTGLGLQDVKHDDEDDGDGHDENGGHGDDESRCKVTLSVDSCSKGSWVEVKMCCFVCGRRRDVSMVLPLSGWGKTVVLPGSITGFSLVLLFCIPVTHTHTEIWTLMLLFLIISTVFSYKHSSQNTEKKLENIHFKDKLMVS